MSKPTRFIVEGKTVGFQAVIVDVGEREKIERKLMATNKTLEMLFQTAMEGVAISDREENLTFTNKAFADILGYEEHELVGMNLRKIVDEQGYRLIKRQTEARKKGKVSTYGLVMYRKDNQERDVQVSASPLWDEHGNYVGTLGIVMDITERKKAEEALKESEERLRALIEYAPDAIYVNDLNGNFIDGNKQAEDMTGYKREELIGKSFLQLGLLPENSFSTAYEMLQKNVFGQKAGPQEMELIKKDGVTITVEVSAIPVQRCGKVEVLGIARDVTERKKMEERLSTLNCYAGMLNAAQSFEQIYELTLNAVDDTLDFDHVSFEVKEKGTLKSVGQRGIDAEPPWRLPLDGSKRGLTVQATITRKPILVHDVTKSTDYVEGLPGIRSELVVPIISENQVLGVLDVESKKPAAFNEKDSMLLQILASHAATAISNITRRHELERRNTQMTLLLKSSGEMVQSTDLCVRLQAILDAIQGLGWRRVVISMVNEDLEVVKPEDIAAVGVSADERALLYKERKSGEVWRKRFGPRYERFRIGAFYHLPWNDPWVRQEFAGDAIPSRIPPHEMVDWDPQDLLYAPLKLADGRVVGIVSIDDPADGRRPTTDSLAPLELFLRIAAEAIEKAHLLQKLGEYAERLEEMVENRTKQLKQAHEQLVKSERLAAIGQVAAMVGHDLRNPLTGIKGATYYLKTRLGQKMDKSIKEMLEIIEKDIHYSNKIITDLLEYSKEQEPELTMTTPKSLIEEALSLVEIPENIQVLKHIQDEPQVMIDAEKMKRVFQNLIKNAVDAMPKGGRLEITSRESSGNMEFVFSDTGTGIPKEIVEKIWTPFFTTKAKGMGLGLAICKRIVEAHNGKISVVSAFGKGTAFTVTLPLSLTGKEEKEGGEKVWINMPESSLSTTTKASEKF
jgi:PAS domain S-box-containing protein